MGNDFHDRGGAIAAVITTNHGPTTAHQPFQRLLVIDMKFFTTTPTILIFICRGLIPTALAAFGSYWLMSTVGIPTFANLAKAMVNGVFLFGCSGACVGYAIERSLSTDYRSRYLQELDRWMGVESLTDDERAAIAMIHRRLEDEL